MITSKSKKIMMIPAVLIMAVVTVVYAAAFPVYADSIFDIAKDIESGKKVSKTLDKDEEMNYKFTPAENGTATVKMTVKKCYAFDVSVYDEDGNSIKLKENITMGKSWKKSGETCEYDWDSKAETFKGTISFDVKANKTYYIKIDPLFDYSGKFEVSFSYPSKAKAPTALMTVTLKKGDTLQLGANGSSAGWSSSDKSVASVSKNGQVKAVKKGKAVITLKCGSQTESIEVIVE